MHNRANESFASGSSSSPVERRQNAVQAGPRNGRRGHNAIERRRRDARGRTNDVGGRQCVSPWRHLAVGARPLAIDASRGIWDSRRGSVGHATADAPDEQVALSHPLNALARQREPSRPQPSIEPAAGSGEHQPQARHGGPSLAERHSDAMEWGRAVNRRQNTVHAGPRSGRHGHNGGDERRIDVHGRPNDVKERQCVSTGRHIAARARPLATDESRGIFAPWGGSYGHATAGAPDETRALAGR